MQKNLIIPAFGMGLLFWIIVGWMLLVTIPGLGIAHAAIAKHCYTMQWKSNHWVCTKWHKDPPPLSGHPSKIHERAGLPASFNVTGQGLEPRTFYELLTTLPFACDFVQVDGWVMDNRGMPVHTSFSIFDRYPGIYGPDSPPLATSHDINEAFIFADVGGNASFSLTVDGCVKRVYSVHLVSLSNQATEFSMLENISVP